MCGFDGEEPPPYIMKLIEKQNLGGVIIFKRNIRDLKQITELNFSLRALHKLPLLIGVDEEGGIIQRLPQPFPRIPPMSEVKREKEAEEIGKMVGVELSKAGFTINFAPVLDVLSNPSNPVIKGRAFSDDPVRVANLGVEYFKSLLYTGVIPCGKHFPGHGDTNEDSHLTLPYVNAEKHTLMKREIFPFEVAIKEGIPVIMTAHCVYTSLDNEHPATLSQKILVEILRKKLLFNGVLITDALEMEAIKANYNFSEIIKLGLKASIDIFMFSKTTELVIEGMEEVKKLIMDGIILKERVEESIVRIEKLGLLMK